MQKRQQQGERRWPESPVAKREVQPKFVNTKPELARTSSGRTDLSWVIQRITTLYYVLRIVIQVVILAVIHTACWYTSKDSKGHHGFPVLPGCLSTHAEMIKTAPGRCFHHFCVRRSASRPLWETMLSFAVLRCVQTCSVYYRLYNDLYYCS